MQANCVRPHHSSPVLTATHQQTASLAVGQSPSVYSMYNVLAVPEGPRPLVKELMTHFTGHEQLDEATTYAGLWSTKEALATKIAAVQALTKVGDGAVSMELTTGMAQAAQRAATAAWRYAQAVQASADAAQVMAQPDVIWAAQQGVPTPFAQPSCISGAHHGALREAPSAEAGPSHGEAKPATAKVPRTS